MGRRRGWWWWACLAFARLSQGLAPPLAARSFRGQARLRSQEPGGAGEPGGPSWLGAPELLTVRSEASLVAQAGLVGAASGVAVSAFKLSIDALEQGSYNGYLREAFVVLGDAGGTAFGSALVYASVPAVGGLVVGFLRACVADFDAAERRSALGPAAARALAAVSTLGTGNSLGPEGPAVELGEAVAARVEGVAARFAPSTDEARGSGAAAARRRKILVGAGKAAGVAAGFSAPIAGIFFALEVAYRDGNRGVLVLPRSAVAATAVSSVLGALVSQDVLQVRLALAAPKYDVGAFPLLELPTYLGLGALCGLVALALLEAIRGAEALWADDGAVGARCPEPLRPALCGLVAGGVGVFCQPVLFNGYATLNTILNNESPGDALTLLSYVALKVALTASSVGAGLVGGLFAPSLFLGATAGGAYGQIVASIADAASRALDNGGGATTALFAVAAPPAYATVGAASVLAAMLRAPLTASMLLFELTRDYDVVLPLVASAGVAALVVELAPARADAAAQTNHADDGGDDFS